MNDKLIIVGIDPGTTLGYAVLDIKGSVIRTASSKNMGLGSLISEIIKLGKVVIIGCDKKKVPGFVEKFASKLGARVISPRQDILLTDKKLLVGKRKTANSHELDALASAMFSYKKITPLLRKIDSFANTYKKHEHADEIKRILLTKDGFSIRKASDLIEKPEEIKKTIKSMKEETKEDKAEDKQHLFLRRELKRLERYNALLKKQNTKLLKSFGNLRKRYSHFKKKTFHEERGSKSEEKINFKEQRLQSLARDLRQKDQGIKELEKRLKKFHDLLAGLHGRILLKKLKNLGWEEFSKKEGLLKIKEDDVLLVNDLSIISGKSIKKLKGKVNILIFRNRANRKLSNDFTIINGKDLKTEDTEHFALADRKDLEKITKKKHLLQKIVIDYRELRENEG